MSKVRVVNLLRLQLHVDVDHADGTVDTVTIMPRSRVDLRDGMTVNKRWLERNAKSVNILGGEQAAAATVINTAPTVAVEQTAVTNTGA